MNRDYENEIPQPDASTDPHRQYSGRGRDASAPPRGLPAKSVTAAVLMSLFPGVGQVYAGYVKRGFTIVVIVASLIFLLNVHELRGLHPFLGMLLPFVWIFNLVDAGRCAQIYNQVATGVAPQELPSELPMPTDLGGRTGGITLIVVGSLLLMVTVFDFSLRWLEDWWPAGLIALGAYMLSQSRERGDRR